MPGRALLAAQLGLTPVQRNAAWLENFVKAYLTAADYLGPAFHARGEPFEPAALINSLLHAYPREVYLQVLTALNHAAQHPDLAEVYRDQFLQRITAAMAARVHSALDGTSDGQAKAFLARQAVLRTMRTVLTYRSTAPAFAGNLGLPVMDPETAGVVLVHLVAAGLRLAQATSTAMIGGVPEDLAMEMVANNLFCRNERANVLLARTRMLWTTYGNQIDLGKLHLRDRPLALLREATGLDLDDIAALTVAYHGYIRAHQPGQPAGVDAFAGIPIERPIIEAYLGLFASTPDELAAKLDACPGSWQMLPIQERPLLRVGDVILVLDEQYLIERATQGLYWFVHDHERDLDSKRGRPRWNNAHAAMVELRVEDQLRLQAPPLIGVAGKTFFTEEDLQAAFPGTMNTDAGIDYGDQVMLAEIVTTQVTVPTRENADVTALTRTSRSSSCTRPSSSM